MASNEKGKRHIEEVGGLSDDVEELRENVIDGLVFEDPFEDEFEEEEFADEDQGDIEENEAGDMDDQGDAKPAAKQVWRPGVDQIGEGEALEYDPSAYVMYHSLQTEWPCLSFDVVRDTLGESRQRVRLFFIVKCLDFL
jgi:hypothetical protein